MTKKALIWLWLLVLGVFMFFCISSKLGAYKSKESAGLTKPVVKIDKPISKDISFKLEKNGDSFIINGILSSKDDFKNLASKYQGLKNISLKFDKNSKNEQIIPLVMSLADMSKKFKSGFLEYHDGVLNINGTVSSEDDKNLVETALATIKDVKVGANIVVEQPKPKQEHFSKLSIAKESDGVKLSGVFSSQTELDSLVKLLSDKGLNVQKNLCVVDSDIKEDRWKVPFVLVVDEFVQFDKGTIQFDKETFSIVGTTGIDGLKEGVENDLAKSDEDIKTDIDITYVKPKPTKEQIQEEVNSILKLKSIRFKTATDVLTDDSKKILDEVASVLMENPSLKVEIAGHTDSDGAKSKNITLSQKRADRVKEYLVEKGVSADNLTAVGYGESKPLVPNVSAKNKQINRRVEFKIKGE